MQRPLPDGAFQVVMRGPKQDSEAELVNLADRAGTPHEPLPLPLLDDVPDRSDDAATVAAAVVANAGTYRLMMSPRDLTLDLANGQSVSALFTEAPNAFACLVLAHGAGAGMRHRFMAAAADRLAERGISTLRYQFPYMEAGSKRVDKPEIAHAAVRAAVAAATGPLPLFAGGKSFGARMTSQAQAVEKLPGVRGLVFFGFPLHPAGKPAIERARHLVDVHIPMLFLQGTRDALADFGLIEGVVSGLSATLFSIPHADHSFHVPAASGRTDAQVLAAILDETVTWMRTTLGFGAAPQSPPCDMPDAVRVP